MKGFILYPTYRVLNAKAQVLLFGRLENGESFVTISDFKPYFWIKQEDRKKAESIISSLRIEGIVLEDSDCQNFDRQPVTKVTLNIPREVPELRKLFLEKNIPCYEADIRFSYRFMIDQGIQTSLEIEGVHARMPEEFYVDRVYINPILSPAYFWPSLHILSFDIETDMEGTKLYSISLYSEKIRTVLLFKENGTYSDAEIFPTEKALLEAFANYIRILDPDVLIGWNCIDFDLGFLRRKFREHAVPFVLGRTGQECSLKLTDSFFTDSSANFPGRAVIDGIHLMKVSFIRLEDYKLNTAAKNLIGEEKLITSDDRHKEITELYDNNPQRLVDYNLKDSILVRKIIDATKILDLSVKRSLLTGMQLDRVNASIASLDSLYLRELKLRKIVAPSAVNNNSEERIQGGFVMESKPGIYQGILVLDFKSLYPSIIRTFNIDPYSYVPPHSYIKMSEAEKKALVTSPNNAHFRNDQGILPQILESLWQQRDIAKKEKDKLASQAIKILMNSFFGVLANPNCRFYSLEVANAITHFGQFLNKLTAEKIRENGYEVIYGDTDSIFVNANTNDVAEAGRIGNELQEFANAFYQAYIRKNYDRVSYLELEFEKAFRKFLMPRVRGSEQGAKKRYAGYLFGSEEVTIVGMETVRRDWTEVSKIFQKGVLNHIFNDKPVENYIRSFVAELKSGKMDSLLVYRKAIRKGVSEYTKTTPPHIKAARKLGRTVPGIIEYVMTINGPEPLEKKTSRLDYDHYIEKQIKPIADSILSFQDKSFDDMVSRQTQTSLGHFG